METDKFYKIKYWNTKMHARLMAEYEYHTFLVEDLGFELTRYGNLIAHIVRSEIDPSYRLEQGALVIRNGVDIVSKDIPHRPEFASHEIDNVNQPYRGLDEFVKTRLTRVISATKISNPRTIAGHQENPPS